MRQQAQDDAPSAGSQGINAFLGSFRVARCADRAFVLARLSTKEFGLDVMMN
jgi:hypothetical protein